MIINAVVKWNGQIAEGANHAECIKKFMDAGIDVEDLSRWNNGYFRTSDGRIIDRKQAKAEFGIIVSEDIPTQYGLSALRTVPDPRKN